MKKKSKNLIICLLVLIILGILYIIIRGINNNKEQAEAENAGIQVADIETEKITEFSFLKEDTVYPFIKTDDIWHYKEDMDFPIDQDIISGLISNLSTITADRKVEISDKDFASYGFDSPENIITYTRENGEQIIYLLGDLNSVTNNYYFNIEGTNEVYMIDETIPNAFSIELYDLVDMGSFPVIGTDEITHITLEVGERILELTDSEIAEDESWTELVQTIAGLAYVNEVDYNCLEEELPLYGLDSPQGVLTIDYNAVGTSTTDNREIDTENTHEVSGDNQVILWIGNSNEDGSYYVKTTDSNEVFTMTNTVIEIILNAVNENYLE